MLVGSKVVRDALARCQAVTLAKVLKTNTHTYKDLDCYVLHLIITDHV